MKSPIITLAVLTLIVAAVFMIIHESNNSINGTILSPGDSSGSARRCKTLTWKLSVPDKAVIIEGMAFEPYYVRIVLPDGRIWLLDRRKKQVVLMNPSKKTAKIILIKNQPPDIYETLSSFKNIRRLSVQMIGQRQIGETQAIGFRGSFGQDKTTFWLDPQTRLPIRIEFLVTNECGQTKPAFMWSDIVFNVELDRSLFSCDIEEYKVEEVDSTWDWQGYSSIALAELNETW
jgi:outer membrane lipoprotein-sorting protein